MGDVVQTLLEGKSRKAEDVLGWNRHTVELGVNEFRTGIRCISDVSARGKKKVEEDNPQLLTHLRRFFMKSGQFLPTARSKINKIF
jgi:hypothetical protein